MFEDVIIHKFSLPTTLQYEYQMINHIAALNF